ncbi:outer membrane lipoprotein chaperone LolA [Methylomarinum sp. Ch1-1]|uniref:Outer-membrane lipoprotein carrier protein n=2 Tax=Methylomarinum roseum TaxID=3067653 RepID=A0AAU7NRD1_9GAMM|nr:outer membrane lipoprotein chaperone LolA [Methylomarinum sp. Ch1-1]MDP4520525.1 outer membrane lipoprotein chaperone LolA [Methylomarinum sp. Ch1-1]
MLAKIRLLIPLIFAVSLAQAAETPEQQLKSFLSSTRSLTADFKQVSFDQHGNPAQTSFGVFYLRRPGYFRWQYQKPFIQEIISNQDKVWFYDADLEQVTIKTIDDSLGATPALLLSGEIDLEESFLLKQQGQDEGLNWIKLSPKNEQSGFKYILIGLSEGKLAGMELSDNFGQLTRIYFSNLKLNPSLTDETFHFEVPEGVDVFGQ